MNQETFGNLCVSFYRRVLLHTLSESIQLSPAFIVPIPPYSPHLYSPIYHSGNLMKTHSSTCPLPPIISPHSTCQTNITTWNSLHIPYTFLVLYLCRNCSSGRCVSVCVRIYVCFCLCIHVHKVYI